MSEQSTHWYAVKITTFTTVDTKKGPVDKPIKDTILIQGVSTADADVKAHEFMKSSIHDYEISSITETKYSAVVK